MQMVHEVDQAHSTSKGAHPNTVDTICLYEQRRTKPICSVHSMGILSRQALSDRWYEVSSSTFSRKQGSKLAPACMCLSTHCNRALPVNTMRRLSSNAVHHGLQLPQQLVALLWCDWNGVQFEEHVVPVQLDASMTSHIICLCGGCVQQAPVALIRMGCEEELQ